MRRACASLCGSSYRLILRPLKGDWCAQGRPPTPHQHQQQQQQQPRIAFLDARPTIAATALEDAKKKKEASIGDKGEVGALPANGGSDTNARAPRRSFSRAVGARRPSASLDDSTRSSSNHSSSTESGDYFEAHTLSESWRSEHMGAPVHS